jgi:hypothetical protein
MSPAIAHTVKTDGNVGVTFHIEPDHNPRAGEPAQAWFALTRQGGQLIPLEQCQCRLAIYRSSENTPILTPPLTSLSAEQYHNIPGAAIVFPKAGVYSLELSGSPKAKAAFKPFKLSYSVTVLPGVPAKTKPTELESVDATQDTLVWWKLGAIASGILLAIASLWLLRNRTAWKGK